MTESPERGNRLLAIDAMRGIAALLVVFYHVQEAFARAPQPWMPPLLAEFLSAGHYGVNIFFVLSGFVIALSLRSANLSWRFAAQFTARRSIRLDPPLWTAILLETALIWTTLRYIPGRSSAMMPTFPQIAANALYLQEFLGYEHISPVFWTLCYEIQFYVTLVMLLVGADAIARRTSPVLGQRMLAAVLFAVFVASLATSSGVVPRPRGLGLERWCEFFFGVLCFWTVTGRVPRWLTAFAAIALLYGMATIGESLIVLLSGAVCTASYLRPSLNRVAARAPLLWLGRISYSLYLFHAAIGYRTVSLGQYVLGSTLSPVLGPLLWMTALAAAVVCSAVLWRMVESPALSLSRRLRLTG